MPGFTGPMCEVNIDECEVRVVHPRWKKSIVATQSKCSIPFFVNFRALPVETAGSVWTVSMRSPVTAQTRASKAPSVRST